MFVFVFFLPRKKVLFCGFAIGNSRQLRKPTHGVTAEKSESAKVSMDNFWKILWLLARLGRWVPFPEDPCMVYLPTFG